MLRWLEHEGYDVTYITDVDTHEDVGRLLRGKGYLSIGHDEYWTEQMRANVIQARDAGVSLGFFGGNYMYWAVDLLADSNGTPNRTISLVDPSKTCTFTCMGAPEQSVVGGNWVNSVPTNGDIVVNARTQAADAPLSHWVFANTGLNIGDVIPGLIGVEYNGIDPGVAIPDGLQTLIHTQAPRFEKGLVEADGGFLIPDNFNLDFNAWTDQREAFITGGGTLSKVCDTSPIPPANKVPPDGYCRNAWLAAFGTRLDWAMTVYQVGSGAWVFNAATNQWSWGLDDYFTGLSTPDGARNGPPFRIQCGYPWFHPGLVSCRNAAAEQITRNVLNKFIAQ